MRFEPSAALSGPVVAGRYWASSSDESGSESPFSRASSGSSTVSSAVVDDEAATAALEWLMSKGKRPHLRLLGAHRDGRLCSACGRRLMQPSPGAGLQEALGAGAPWSPRCWAKLPEEWQRAFTAAAA